MFLRFRGFYMTHLIRHIVLPAIILLLTAVTAFGAEERPVTLHFFWGTGCQHCARARPFLADLAKQHPGLRVVSREVFNDDRNLAELMRMSRELGEEATGVPVFIVEGRMFSGFSEQTAQELKACVTTALTATGEPEAPPECPVGGVAIPLFGQVNAASLSLPVFTVVVAALDSFNPCAFFVLFFLLSLLLHVHSRFRMALVGGIFVLFSGLVYFLFMAAWLNLFLVVGQLAAFTVVAGLIAVVIAGINIKDFFRFHEGVSLTIPEEAKPRLFARMREIVHAGSLPAMLAATVTLAVVANSYELLCTAGFPMVFTRVLTLNRLSSAGYYLYLAFYNLVYIVPLAVIVGAFVLTLGSRKLTEWQGRVLKLVSGCMMLVLGTVLLTRPQLLNNALVSLAILAASLLAAWLISAFSCRKWPERFGPNTGAAGPD
jgi:thiol-disulfide isomerase/thioredoxin